MILKNVLSALCLFGASTLSFGQSITGIGDFKIGMSVSEFLELPTTKKLYLVDKSSKMPTAPKWDLVRTTSGSAVDKYEKFYSSDTIKFDFFTATGVQPKVGEDSYHASIYFFKNKLSTITIHSAGFEFKDILTAKYGEPVFNDEARNVECQNAYGAKTNHKDGASQYIWGKGKAINAIFHISQNDCGKIVTSYTVRDVETESIRSKIEEQGRKADATEDIKAKARNSLL